MIKQNSMKKRKERKINENSKLKINTIKLPYI